MARDYVQEYFASDDPEAPLALLRELTGLTVDIVSDPLLTRACRAAVQTVERVTGLRFTKHETTIHIAGSGSRFLELPEPLYVLNTITDDDDDELEEGDGYLAHATWVSMDGGWNHFRLYPQIAKVGLREVWPVDMVFAVDGEWGMVDEDGEIPHDVQRATARLAVLEAYQVADEDSNERRRLGSIVSQKVQGRSVTVREAAASPSGLIGDEWVREVLKGYRLPRVSSSAARAPANLF